MSKATIKTPGVFINEVNGFGNSVAPVATAIPAFIGYTPQALHKGKSCINIPTKITSFSEFQTIFCCPKSSSPADTAKQYSPQYYLIAETSQPEKGDYILVGDRYYTIVPDPSSVYYLYNSIRLFYENGGGDAYIVSVGTYGAVSGVGMTPGNQIINANVKLNDLIAGLDLLRNEEEPTMYICPEATLLSVENNGTLMQAMLLQCEEMRTAISIFDIIGGRNPDPILYTNDITTFRNNTGNRGLNYGTAYYPYVGTTIMQSSDIDYTNLFGGNLKQLKQLLSPASNPNTEVESVLSTIENPHGTALTVIEYNNSLIAASKTYASIMKHVLADANVLPPSSGMAGVITTVDNQVGPWRSPANVSMETAVSLPMRLSESEQGDLNIDTVSGKSINAIRFFNGLGILIWGARTLDGNSLDWRYLSVRRTITFLEQSCKQAVGAYVFAANDVNTWKAIESMINSFLNRIWKEGGLSGYSPDEAFSVNCGLGSTMTGEDLLNGFLKVSIKVAVVRPAEFIEISIQQQMARS